MDLGAGCIGSTGSTWNDLKWAVNEESIHVFGQFVTQALSPFGFIRSLQNKSENENTKLRLFTVYKRSMNRKRDDSKKLNKTMLHKGANYYL